MIWKKDWILEQLEVLTVGIPFCMFKFLTALVLWRLQHNLFADILFILGLLDLFINVGNFIALCWRKKRLWGVCTLTLLLSKLGVRIFPGPWGNVGTSLDVMLSMLLVAAMLGAGGFMFLRPSELLLWNYSVVLNVLGAGLSRMAYSLKDLAQKSGHP